MAHQFDPNDSKEAEKKPHSQTYTGRRSVKEPPPDADVMIANTMTMAKKKKVSVIGQRIRHFREKKGIEQKALAKEIGIIGNAISNWECGRARPDIALLPKLCMALDISIDELFDMPPARSTGKEMPDSESTDNSIRVSSASGSLNPIAESLLDRYFQLSVGHQMAIDSLMEKLLEAEDIEFCSRVTEQVLFSKQLAAGFDPGEEFDDKGEAIYLYRTRETETADCVFTVSGDSMEPEYHNGDKVLVQRFPRCTELQPGDIGAFITGNETYIKEYRKDGLYSLNKRYKPMKFNDDDKVYIIGRVVGILHPEEILTFTDTVRYEKAKARLEERMQKLQ